MAFLDLKELEGWNELVIKASHALQFPKQIELAIISVFIDLG